MNQELADFLKFFGFSTLKSFIKTEKKDEISDPNELSMDDEESIYEDNQEHIEAINIFEDFGIGPLIHHPLFTRLFPITLNTNRIQSFIPAVNVLTCLKDYLVHNKSGSLSHQHFSRPEAVSFHFNSFHQYLLSVLNIDSLQDVGILLNPANALHLFQDMIFEISYIQRKMVEERDRWRKQQIKTDKQQIKSQFQVLFKSLDHKTNEDFGIGNDPKLSVPLSIKITSPSDNAIISTFIESCQNYSNSNYSLTKKKIDDFVENYLASSNIFDVDANENGKKRKASKLSHPNENDEVDQYHQRLKPLSEITKEYLFLCCGKSAKLQNKFQVIYQHEQSTSGNDEEIDIDLEEDQNDSDGVKNSISCEPKPNLFPISTENHQSGRLKVPEESLIPKEYSLLFQPSPMENEEWIEIIPNSQIRALFSRNSLLFAPNSLESQENVGRWGERFVFHYLNQITPLSSNNQNSSLTSTCSSSSSSSSSFVIDWINEKEESNAFYDLTIKEKTFSTRSGGAQDISFAEKLIFIEVKTTSMDSRKNVFQISWNEFQFAMKSPKVPYYIFRVYSAKDLEKISIVILKDIPKLIEAGRVQLCLAT